METHEQYPLSGFEISLPTPAVVIFLLILSSAMILSAPRMAQAQTLDVLATFTQAGRLGYGPASGLVMDQDGRLYGTNYSGGAHGWGAVYRLSRAGSGWIATALYDFQGGADGSNPTANITFGPDGSLYGITATTPHGFGFGAVYRLRPPAAVCKASQCPWTETVLYTFTGGSDGGISEVGASADTLIFDNAGNIYGTTPFDGAAGCGVVFKLTPSGEEWTESVLWNFTCDFDGGFPFSGVIFDRAGNLYGTTQIGGSDGGGVVYELSPSGSGWTQSTLYSFVAADNGDPIGGVVLDAQGNIYGTTGCEGDGGEAYELSPANGTWQISKRQVLTSSPCDTPTLDAQGNLWGTGSAGGLGFGEVFKLTPSGNAWTYTRFYEFTRQQSVPEAGVLFDANGNLFGTSADGGQHEDGIAWEITP